jgi:hypothetical protein
MAVSPVFLEDAMPEDDAKLFELGDLVTWPVVSSRSTASTTGGRQSRR